MNSYQIFNLSDKNLWNKYLSRLPINKKDIYFTPEYYELYEKNGDGLAKCFIFEKGEEIGVYPFLINSINELGYSLSDVYYDIQGVYGYNGVLTNSKSNFFLNEFFVLFDEYCMQENIVAEFLRINPLLDNPLTKRKKFDLTFDRDNIFVNLLNDNIFENDYEYSTRKNIRKALRNGLSFKSVLGNEIGRDDLKTFCEIYYHTMERNKVNQYYYFDYKFFEGIANNLQANALFTFVLLKDKVITCEIVLLGSNTAYSFLGGTYHDYYQYRPNDFLKHSIISLLKEKGYHKYLLGGGSEGVFKYKKSFSKNGIIPFHIGKKIHNNDIYEQIVKQWEEKNDKKIPLFKHFLLKYRY